MTGRNRALDMLGMLILLFVIVSIPSRGKKNRSGWTAAFLNGLRLLAIGGVILGIGWLIFG